jgi:hypothetical protein
MKRDFKMSEPIKIVIEKGKECGGCPFCKEVRHCDIFWCYLCDKEVVSLKKVKECLKKQPIEVIYE